MKNFFPPSIKHEKVEKEIAVTYEKMGDIVYGLYGVMDVEIKALEEK